MKISIPLIRDGKEIVRPLKWKRSIKNVQEMKAVVSTLHQLVRELRPDTPPNESLAQNVMHQKAEKLLLSALRDLDESMSWIDFAY